MTVQIGQEAPGFTRKNQHGADVTLSQFRGSSVVVMFYPFAFSGICTSELGEVRDQLPRFTAAGSEVLAVSCDPMFSLRAFADREGLGFSLLSDFWPHGEVASAYGVFDAERGCALRGTFVLDPAGTVRWKVENGLPDARDLQDCLDALGAISV
ncbi:MAG: peroxiredoxin [Nocardioidaceae bacterium]